MTPSDYATMGFATYAGLGTPLTLNAMLPLTRPTYSHLLEERLKDSK